ncbi:MAG TPA: lactate utilization protein [Clostridia bacterium]|nr:lactate utilization protein [Clostridia bacterium]
MFSADYDRLVSNLKRRKFTVHAAKDATEAREIGLALIADGSVGFGGSQTVADLGLYEALKAQGNEVYSHTYAPKEEKDAVRRMANGAKWYVASTNALTEDGVLINIDGSGNRVASMIMGPENVLLFIGKNKLAKNIDAGLARIKREACPLNARRLNFKTLPCGITGTCVDCSSEERMCRVTVLTEMRPRLIKSFHLVLIDEAIGW